MRRGEIGFCSSSEWSILMVMGFVSVWFVKCWMTDGVEVSCEVVDVSRAGRLEKGTSDQA